MDELEPFLLQIEHLAKKFAPTADQSPLLNVAMMKLKGKAASFFNRVKANTWEGMQQKLREQFSKKFANVFLFVYAHERTGDLGAQYSTFVNIDVYLIKTMPELMNLQMLRPNDDQLVAMYEFWRKHASICPYVPFCQLHQTFSSNIIQLLKR